MKVKSTQKKEKNNAFGSFFKWTGILIGLGLLTTIVSVPLLVFLPQTSYPVNLAASVLLSLLIFFYLKKGNVSFADSIKKDWRTGIFLGIALLFILYRPLGIVQFVYETDRMAKEGQANNPAKELASIIPPFAEEHNFTFVKEYNGGVSFGNQNLYYSYTYTGDQSLDEMKELIETFLQKKGYEVTITKEIDEEGKISSETQEK